MKKDIYEQLADAIEFFVDNMHITKVIEFVDDYGVETILELKEEMYKHYVDIYTTEEALAMRIKSLYSIKE